MKHRINSICYPDESRFCLGMQDDRRRIKCCRGEQPNTGFATFGNQTRLLFEAK